MTDAPQAPDHRGWQPVAAPALDPAAFRQWQQLVAERLDMALPNSREVFLRTALWSRMRVRDMAAYAEYWDAVTTAPDAAAEWRLLVDKLTVQETRFHRHPASFALVRRHLLRLAREGDRAPVELWSVGCSTGEEPWTLAMLADDVLAPVPRRWGVVGSDVSTQALQAARAGVYPARRAIGLPADLRARYLEDQPRERVRVADRLRDRVAFSLQNLKDVERAPQQRMHVIYCQNVLIYFRRERRCQILDALAARLAPGGILVMAAGEAVDWRPDTLARIPGTDVVAWTRAFEGEPEHG